jgi:amino acid adenylation domain-containing protein
MNREIHLSETRLAATQFIKEKEYWLQELSGELNLNCFAGDILQYEGKPSQDIYNFVIGGELFERLVNMSAGSDPNLHIVITAAIAAVLKKHTNRGDIILGTTIDRQEREGKLANRILPLRIQTRPDMTFKELILHVKEKMNLAIENQNYPIEHLVYEDLAITKTDYGFPLFDVGVVLANLQDKAYIEGLGLNMVLEFSRADQCLECRIDYNSTRCTKAAVERIHSHITSFMSTALFNVDRQLFSIDILSPRERNLVLNGFNCTHREYPNSKPVHMLFEEKAASIPEAITMVYKDEYLTYSQLNKRANRLARVLSRCGIRQDQPVGILMDRTPLMVQGILAVWKAGGAYVPLDTQYPFRRTSDILIDSGATVLLSLAEHIDPPLDSAFKDSIQIIKGDRYEDEIKKEPAENIEGAVDMGSLAYIIYTSGSTGKPKGVMVEHRGMLNHMFAKITDLQLSSSSILAQNSSHTFDISVWQFFSALIPGGRTVIFPVDHIFDLGVFIKQLIKHRVTVLELIPSYLAVMLEVDELENHRFIHLEYLLVTGETVTPNLVKQWFKRCPGIKMVNAYGPTEASDDITHFIMDQPVQAPRIPIGKPLQNLNIYIVNDDLQPCPIGVKGEICVSGIGVGRGYKNDEIRTRQVFIEDPFALEKKTRLYKTGDIGRWLSNGNIDFLGRKDHQVKIRGFRIELEEIENALNEYPGIRSTALVDKTYEDGNKYLCAYFIAEETLNITGIKKYLSEKLPYYMIPAHFVRLDQFPLTSNGKIHRKALQAMKHEKSTTMKFISEEMIRIYAAQTANINIHGEIPGDEDIIDNEDRPLTWEQKEQLLYTFNNTKTNYPKDKTIHELFRQQVERTPDHVVLVGASSGRQGHHNTCHLSYSELNGKARQTARLLRENGIQTGTDNIVGIMTERSVEMIIGILSILKAGAAYLPIGDENPKERIKFMLEDCQTEIILTDKQEQIPGYTELLLDINRIRTSSQEEDLGHGCTGENLAYVIYTSGTTGLPKGVMLEHRQVINFIKGMTDIIEFTTSSRILSLITISFDIFVLEAILPLTTGSRIAIGNRKAQTDPETGGKQLINECITTFQCTPSMLQILAANEIGSQGLHRLEYLIVGGEVFPEMLLENLRGKTGAKIYNVYGPTETTVWSTARLLEGVDRPDIGKPIANTQIYILNKKNMLCPVGIIGELCIGGDGLARGYLGRDDLTAEKFVENPFITGNCIYRTGDLAHWKPDGSIEFLGRKDHQIKVNGIRVELGEIENILLKHPEIKEAIVLVKKAAIGTKKTLWGFLSSPKRLSEAEIREYLSEQLPSYMIPSTFVQLEKIPLIPSGKADKKLLQAVELEQDENYVPPGNETQQKLQDIWKNNLGLEKVGVIDNFFNIGGDSIKSISLINKVNQEFETNLKIRDLFQNETIEKLADIIDKSEVKKTGPTEEYQQTLKELELLKDKFMMKRRK